ncbi:MAG: glycosyltransferase [Parvularculaceae bacterium]
MVTGGKRIFYVLIEYPQLSQTYVANEIAALRADGHQVFVAALNQPDTYYDTDVPYEITKDFDRTIALIREFRPDVLHGHWLYTVPLLEKLSRKMGIPYTVRAHSFDITQTGPKAPAWKTALRRARMLMQYRDTRPPDMAFVLGPYLKGDHCLGVLTFPYGRQKFLEAGVAEEKVHDCFPVMDFARFHDETPNGEDVMNVGACTPKKKMEDFVDLAVMVPERHFRLYPVGFQAPRILEYNREHGSPVEFAGVIPQKDMAREYKRHQWLVYTAEHNLHGDHVGWSVAVAEAQASGVGVCFPNMRPDLKQYVGEGSGYLYNRIEEIAEIVRNPVPEDVRRKGFEQAKKSDIRIHKKILTDIWDKVA